MGAPVAWLTGAIATRIPCREGDTLVSVPPSRRQGGRDREGRVASEGAGGKGGAPALAGVEALGCGEALGAVRREPLAHMSIVFCLVPKRLFRRPITLLWIWQTRLSVRFSISPISRIVCPTW